MKKKTLLLLAAAVFVYWFFFSIIPVTVVHGSHFFWGFVGGIAAGVCIFLAGRMSDEEKYDIDTYSDNKRRETLFIVPAVLVALIGSFVIAMHASAREKEFLKKNPVLVDGTITDGESRTSRRSSSYELTVEYKDKAGREYTSRTSVSSMEWNNAGKGMPVKVVYEKDNPSIFKVLMNPGDAKEYMGQNLKLFPSLQQMQQILNTDSKTKTLALLGDGWKQQRNSENATVFYNAISTDNFIQSSIGNIYLNENGQADAYNALLAEARKTMEVVYDSISTNRKKGVLFQNDSMQLRFQQYSRLDERPQGQFAIPGLKTVYCFGFTKKDEFLLLPGDLEKTQPDADDLRQLLRKKSGN